jgi:hypothetical protein
VTVIEKKIFFSINDLIFQWNHEKMKCFRIISFVELVLLSFIDIHGEVSFDIVRFVLSLLSGIYMFVCINSLYLDIKENTLPPTQNQNATAPYQQYDDPSQYTKVSIPNTG